MKCEKIIACHLLLWLMCIFQQYQRLKCTLKSCHRIRTEIWRIIVLTNRKNKWHYRAVIANDLFLFRSLVKNFFLNYSQFKWFKIDNICNGRTSHLTRSRFSTITNDIQCSDDNLIWKRYNSITSIDTLSLSCPRLVCVFFFSLCNFAINSKPKYVL